MKVTRQRAQGRLATYRWSCGACSNHVWLPASSSVWVGLFGGGGLLLGGLAAVFVPGLVRPEDGGAAIALVAFGGAMTVWAARYLGPLLRHPRTD